MAKNNTKIVNNIDTVNLEIDYKKLAKEIVLAQEEAQKSKRKHKGYRASFMAVINTMIFALFAVIAVFSCIGMWRNFISYNEYSLFDCITYTLMFIGVVIISVLCCVESWRDNDEAAIQYFNTNVSLVALIVALIAIVKEVG